MTSRSATAAAVLACSPHSSDAHNMDLPAEHRLALSTGDLVRGFTAAGSGTGSPSSPAGTR